MFDSADPTDEEVRYINSAAKHVRGAGGVWGSQSSAGGVGGGSAVGVGVRVGTGGPHGDVRSHSLSPFASGTSSLQLAKNCGSAANLAALRDRDMKKFFSVDTKGFLDKPSACSGACGGSIAGGVGDDLRRHSIEICPSMDVDVDADDAFDQALAEVRHPPMRGQSLYIPRKKKTSPPCISIDAPLEAEGSPVPHKPTAANINSTLLRRRTPSCEQTQLLQQQQQRESMDLMEHQVLQNQPLLSIQAHGSTSTEYQASTVPQITFDQSDSTIVDSGLSNPLLDSNPVPRSSPFDGRLEESTDFCSPNRTAL